MRRARSERGNVSRARTRGIVGMPILATASDAMSITMDRDIERQPRKKAVGRTGGWLLFLG
jgi:hypothetical protein